MNKTEIKLIGYIAPSIEMMGVVVERGFNVSSGYPGGDVETNPFNFSEEDSFNF